MPSTIAPTPMAMAEISPFTSHTKASEKSAPNIGGTIISGIDLLFLNDK